MKRLLLTCSLLMAAATLSFAGNPKGETKAETPTETKSEVTLNTYYVTGESGSNYTLSTAPNPDCDEGQVKPCEITTNLTLGATVSKSAVDNQVNITIQTRQPEF